MSQKKVYDHIKFEEEQNAEETCEFKYLNYVHPTKKV